MDTSNPSSFPAPEQQPDKQVEQRQPHSFFIIALITLLLIIIAIVGLYMYTLTQVPVITSTPTETPQPFLLGHTLDQQVPAHLPKDIIQEQGVTALDSFHARDKSGEYQETYRYVSKNNIATNAATYKAYMIKNGWIIVNSTTDKKTFATLTGKKDIFTLMVSAGYNTVQQVSTVEITLSYHPSIKGGSL